MVERRDSAWIVWSMVAMVEGGMKKAVSYRHVKYNGKVKVKIKVFL